MSKDHSDEKFSLDLSLGVEEVALAMNALGYSDAASVLLTTTFDEMQPREQEMRLLAAGHSLMARELLSIEEGQPRLRPDFAQLLDVIMRPSHIFQLGLHFEAHADSTEQGESGITFYLKDGVVIEQHVREGVVHTLRTVRSKHDAVASVIRVLGTDGPLSDGIAEVADAQASVPLDTLQQLRDVAASPVETLVGLLEEAGLPDGLAIPLAEDFHDAQAQGTTLLLEYKGEEMSVNEAALLLRGPRRAWLFLVNENEGAQRAEIKHASANAIEERVRLLFETPGNKPSANPGVVHE